MTPRERHRWTLAAVLLLAAGIGGHSGGLGSPQETRRQAQGAQAILFEPGSVNASVTDQAIWLANGSLVVTWDLTRGGIRLASIYDRLGGRPAPRTGEVFAAQVTDGTIVRSSEFRPAGAPRIEATASGGGALPGKTVAADFQTADGRMRATWRASLAGGADYVRQELTLAPGRGTLAVASIVLIDVEARDPRLVSTGPGVPAVGGGAFFAVEHAASACAAQESGIRCEVRPAAALTAREPFRAAWVIGLARPAEVLAGLRLYAQREGGRVPPSILAALEAAPAPGSPAPRAAAAQPVTLAAGPYLQAPRATEMTVMWVTDQPSAGWVEYGTDPSTFVKAFAVRDGLVEAGGAIHRVRLTGLKPETTYSYRAVSRAILDYGPYKVDYGATVRSPTARFHTPPATPRPFSFVVLNDLHEDVDVMAAHMDRAMATPPDLVFLNGDSLSHLESDQQIVNRLLAPASRLFASEVPFVLVRGNHETRGKHARRLGDHLALPDGRYYHAFTYGPVRFVVLDCGEDKEDGHWAYSGLTAFDDYRAVEAAWLKEEAASAAFRGARFRVLVAHMPFFGNEGTNVRGHGPTQCRERWGRILNDAGLDLHIAGHTHRTNWVPPAPGANRFPVLVGGSSARGSSTMIRVEVTADRLATTVTSDDGTVLGTYAVARSTGPAPVPTGAQGTRGVPGRAP